MRVVELFCGAGGMSLGLRRAGFELVQAYDAWDRAVDVYRTNPGPLRGRPLRSAVTKMVPMGMKGRCERKSASIVVDA